MVEIVDRATALEKLLLVPVLKGYVAKRGYAEFVTKTDAWWLLLAVRVDDAAEGMRWLDNNREDPK